MKASSIITALLLAAPALAAPAAAPACADDMASLEKRASYSVTYDDGDYATTNDRFDYGDGWTHLTNQGLGLYKGTTSYTGKNGEVDIYLPGVGKIPASAHRYNIKLWSTLKNDRGRVNIYCGKTNIAAPSQYTSGKETNSQVFWSVETLRCDSGYLVLKNDGGAAYMALDRVDFTYT